MKGGSGWGRTHPTNLLREDRVSFEVVLNYFGEGFEQTCDCTHIQMLASDVICLSEKSFKCKQFVPQKQISQRFTGRQVKMGRRKDISEDQVVIIEDMIKHFKEQQKKGGKISNINRKVAGFAKVSVSTVQRIHSAMEKGLRKPTADKKGKCGVKKNLDSFDEAVLRRIIHRLYSQHVQPSLWRITETKQQLLHRVKLLPDTTEYMLEREAQRCGHQVLWLPPKHCDLNPIELISAEGSILRKCRQSLWAIF